ncbi:MAG: ribose ABC transporter permease [Melioribacteraceae bacterium]|nr:ribose ABC transporter permease [Melioribacteraceae bacterium]
MIENSDIKKQFVKFQSLIALVIMVIAISLLADDFLSVDNAWNVMRQISVNVIISVGMTMVILTAGIDLSVGSILAISGAVAAGLLRNGIEIPGIDLFVGVTVFGAILIGILVGSILGWFNGFMITKFKVPPFVATLAMLTIARGLTNLWTQGAAITGLDETFVFLGSGWFVGIPMPVWISIIVVGIAILVTNKTRYGRYIYAVGGNESAAKLSGLNVKKVKILVYTIAGALSAVGGIILTARLDSATPIAGTGYELDSIAAVVIGGTSLDGGRGSILGTVQGALIIGVLNSGLVMMGVDPFWQQVVKGAVILFAVVIDKWSSKE